MIPIIYKLRDAIRFEPRGDSFLVVSEAPLNVINASGRAARILRLCDGKRTIQDFVDHAGVQEDQVFKVCDYFNRKSVLEISLPGNQSFFPFVSVVIPTRDRAKSVVECLESIYAQEYPSDHIEIIVVDDGSTDDTRKLVGSFPCVLLANPESRGQSHSRNLGARHAKHEILAFMDDDCVASRTWLKELTPFLQWEKIGAVGGYVDGYSNSSLLDRYEKVFSLLNLGKHLFRSVNDQFFVPTCNMLVRMKTFNETGGIRETLHIGEDVDFCWRMCDAGWQALYVPSGIVLHKHRNTLGAMLRRRADYGTSEAVLCALHPHKRKTMQWHPLAFLAFFSACLAIILRSPLPLIATTASIGAEIAAKALHLHGKRIRISLSKVFASVVRMHISHFRTMSFHLIRYYLCLFFLSGIAFHPLWILGATFLLLSASIDYFTRRPRLFFLAFLFYYVLDHISYQLGVVAGCLRSRTFRPYFLHLLRRSGSDVNGAG